MRPANGIDYVALPSTSYSVVQFFSAMIQTVNSNNPSYSFSRGKRNRETGEGRQYQMPLNSINGHITVTRRSWG